jgi:hypothetical protein
MSTPIDELISVFICSANASLPETEILTPGGGLLLSIRASTFFRVAVFASVDNPSERVICTRVRIFDGTAVAFV